MPPKSKSSSKSSPATGMTPKKSYLIAYNAISCALWATILYRTILIVGPDLLGGGKKEEGIGASLKLNIFGEEAKGYEMLFGETGEFVKWAQTAAMMEILHSLFGLVNASVFTTAMQVASRFLLVWAICDQFPSVPASSIAYSTMLVAWSTTEVIRYSYFVCLLTGSVPGFMQFLRYNTFFILYPLGISSEMWLVYKSAGPAAERDERLPYVLYGILCLYVPGAYILYSHMMSQRRKVLRAAGKQKAK
ncbi:hypothetical protein BLS_004168 [Venturia inaequalis]|uniref:Very-long-chain (3R)-3-hydroxyacyl-CoA dehydratase n=1 Tax=Venturia inaequalis TaxID=5025 RepID=A0A8H3UK79_VENIN|nr:hypothetical protein BLS_004168 [Venturia inaequalis]